VIVLSEKAPAATRWLAHFVRAAAGAIRRGDRFDDDLPFDAAEILRLALQQRVAPLLHRGCEDGAIGDPVPDSFREACWRSYYATVRRNVIALETGRDVLAALGEHGVDAAPLGAWALLEGPGAVYEDVGTRPLDDLELIVAADARPRATAVLRALGLIPTGASSPDAMGTRRALTLRARAFDVDLFVSLHATWDVPASRTRSAPVSGERFLAELCAPWSANAHVHAPTRVGNLCVAAERAGRHSLARWIWLLDLHRIVIEAPPDWDAVVRSARAWRVSGPLYAGLAATRELLRTPIPKEVVAALAPGPVRRRLLHRSLAAGARGSARPARVARLLLGESWWDVARSAASAALPVSAGVPRIGRRAAAAR
jgi:hypothetical protein